MPHNLLEKDKPENTISVKQDHSKPIKSTSDRQQTFNQIQQDTPLLKISINKGGIYKNNSRTNIPKTWKELDWRNQLISFILIIVMQLLHRVLQKSLCKSYCKLQVTQQLVNKQNLYNVNNL